MSTYYEAAVEIREAIFTQFPDSQERRRYALLQAAATIDGGQNAADSVWTVEECVDRAEKLLAEIEKREKREDS